MTLVVDASAIAALVFDEPQGESIRRKIRLRELAAPLLLSFEMAQICTTKIRLFPAQSQAMLNALDAFSRLAIRLVPVNVPAVVALAGDTRLSAYDASYLWLARTLDAELVTLDKGLQAAADAPIPPA
jgi:predicted nucleic acid-binding protein